MLREILPLFLMPVFVALVLLVVALRTRRRWPVVVALILLWAASTPVVSNVLMRAVEDWRVRQVTGDAPNADAIVVLSFGIRDVPGDATSFEFDDFDRFLGGFDLYRAGKAPRLIFTGVGLHGNQICPWLVMRSSPAPATLACLHRRFPPLVKPATPNKKPRALRSCLALENLPPPRAFCLSHPHIT